jgi:hypothetical protein
LRSRSISSQIFQNGVLAATSSTNRAFSTALNRAFTSHLPIGSNPDQDSRFDDRLRPQAGCGMRAWWVATLGLALLVAGCGDDDGVTSTTTTAEQPQPKAASPSDQVVLACLGSEGTPDDVQALWDRVSVPSDTGVGTDLAVGIAAVSARGNGIAVEFEVGAATADRERVLDVLDEPPVEAVLNGTSVQVCA